MKYTYGVYVWHFDPGKILFGKPLIGWTWDFPDLFLSRYHDWCPSIEDEVRACYQPF